jgi:hypothetical protein
MNLLPSPVQMPGGVMKSYPSDYLLMNWLRNIG